MLLVEGRREILWNQAVNKQNIVILILIMTEGRNLLNRW